MRYKQPAAILRTLAQKASAKVRLASIELLGQQLPNVGKYKSGSPENLLWQLASDDKAPPSKRYQALCRLLITLAQKQKAKS
jgi:hypothetical protein